MDSATVIQARVRPRRRAIGRSIAIAAIVLFSGAAFHGLLRSSVPSNGAHLSAAPTELRLTFNEKIELPLARIELLDPTGSAVALGKLSSDSTGKIITAPITGRLIAGGFTVVWRVVGKDGHPVTDKFTFTIAPGASGLSAELPADTTGRAQQPTPHDPVTIPTGGEFDASSTGYVITRWLNFIGILMLIGVVAVHFVVLPIAGRQAAEPAFLQEVTRRAVKVANYALALLVIATGMRLLAQSYALHGREDILNPALIGTMLSRTTWGWSWLLQAAAVILTVVSLRNRKNEQQKHWSLLALAALMLALTPAMSGHAVAGGKWPVVTFVADVLHVIGAGGWVGSLLVVLIAGVPAAMSLADNRGAAVRVLINAFSPTALVFAGIVVLTGLVAAWVHLNGSPPALWESAYGRTLLIKLALLIGVFGTGAYNWRRVRPALGDVSAAHRLQRSALVELVVAVLVVGVTAVLVATTPPDAEAHMASGSAAEMR